VVLSLYDSHYPFERRPQPMQTFLWLLSLLWKAGSARDRRAKLRRVRRLPVSVVSVGNITAGGTGKTPVTIELLQEFRDEKAGLLTRGHGRTVRENVLLLDQNNRPPVSLTGDEAQLCAHAASVPIGIGADRGAVGKQLLEAADVRILFLDDGFQHLQLHRDLDLVLIDALRPFGGGELLPLGRLREPLNGLARADAFLITRADEVPNTRAIEAVLRGYNPTAPIFCTRTIACKWRASDGSEVELETFAAMVKETRAIAFCGLGNPEAFWRTLRKVGIEPLKCYEYDDHHHYTPAELRLLARHARDIGAGCLVTTAKDAVNLDPEYPAIIGALKLYRLEVRTEIDGREELISFIRKAVQLKTLK
jgi:tetraacyldisaccharide 4'-kinase